MIAEVTAMVAGQDDHGVVEKPARFQKGHQPGKVIVDLLDQAHVGRDDVATVLLFLEREAVVMVHEGGDDRMNILEVPPACGLPG